MPFEDQPFDGIDRTFGTFPIRHLHACRKWLRRVSEYGNTFNGFIDVLDKFAFSSHVTDACDRVYTFLALADPGMPKSEADYTKAISTVYKIFSATLAHNTGSLSFLGLVRGDADQGIPSWAVDWRTKSSCGGRGTMPSARFPSKASKGRKHKPGANSSADLNQFRIRGRIVDTVNRVLESPDSRAIHFPWRT